MLLASIQENPSSWRYLMPKLLAVGSSRKKPSTTAVSTIVGLLNASQCFLKASRSGTHNARVGPSTMTSGPHVLQGSGDRSLLGSQNEYPDRYHEQQRREHRPDEPD